LSIDAKTFGGKAGNYTTIVSCKMKFPQVKLKTIKEALSRDTLDYHKKPFLLGKSKKHVIVLVCTFGYSWSLTISG